MDLSEVCLQALVADGTFADLQFGFGIVVDVVDTHLIRDGEPSQRYVGTTGRVVPASCDQCIALSTTVIMFYLQEKFLMTRF